MRPGSEGQQPGQNILDDSLYIEEQKRACSKALFVVKNERNIKYIMTQSMIILAS